MVDARAAGEHDEPEHHVQSNGRKRDVDDTEKGEESSDPRRQPSVLVESAAESGTTSLNSWGQRTGGNGGGSGIHDDGNEETGNDDEEEEESNDSDVSNAASDRCPEWAPCSILQWEPWDEQDVHSIAGEDDGNFRATTSVSGDNGTRQWRCESTKLSTSQALQDYLRTDVDPDKPRPEDSEDKGYASILSSPPPRPASTQPTSLLVINKLQANLLAVLVASPQGLDWQFLEIHAEIRRPPVLGSSFASARRRSSSRAIIATWTYPELVAERTGSPVRSLRDTPLRPLLTTRYAFPCPEQDIGLYRLNDTQRPLWAAFSHATLRAGGRVKGEGGRYQRMADILLADSRFQEHTIQDENYLRSARGHPFVRANRDGIHAAQYEPSAEDNCAGTSEALFSRRVGGGDKYQSLEQTLRESWMDAAGSSFSTAETALIRMRTVEEAAYEHWLDFFDVVQPHNLRQRSIASKGDENPCLAWRAMQALERNQAMSMALHRIAQVDKRQTGVTMDKDSIPGPDWAALIRRVEMRVALLPLHPLASFAPPLPLPPTPPIPYMAPRVRASSLYSRSTAQEADINATTAQRALDRITYLGGILLPMSIVASILSMNDKFEPGAHLFWVFWLAAVPLTLSTVGFIYADQLRRVMVWQEVDDDDDDDHVQEGGQSHPPPTDSDLTPSSEKGTRIAASKIRFCSLSIAMSPAEIPLPPSRSSGSSATETLEKWPRRHGRNPPTSPTLEPPRATPFTCVIAGDESVSSASSASQQDFVIDMGDKAEEIHAGAARMVSSRRRVYEGPGAGPGQLRRRHGSGASDDGRRRRQRPQNQRVWQKKELGWGGAVMCMLRMQSPQQAVGGLPSEGYRVSRDDSRTADRAVRPGHSHSRGRERERERERSLYAEEMGSSSWS